MGAENVVSGARSLITVTVVELQLKHRSIDIGSKVLTRVG